MAQVCWIGAKLFVAAMERGLDGFLAPEVIGYVSWLWRQGQEPGQGQLEVKTRQVVGQAGHRSL